ncbi:protein kinase (incomplete catalytic triad), putative [Eimeria mitis]|uniref:Protein kinase (Incomplete catalytic triad), putative n=1 Tax=Eimeria mitis TaxID=44415 RepID=U6KGS8_9EIME|nr:protein kinase (incomplete catalytic triad), putative [Eimeria mitis]CDJ35981.1 protein kinase (incomplete catalytic triad), putative [Eimeria mitis]
MNMQAPGYGALGDKILWPPGFVAVQRMPGNAAHGETWLIKNDANAQKEELTKEKAKLEEAIARLDVGIEQAAQHMEEEQDEAYEQDEHYDDEMDYAERFDPHDREDPEVLLEERQQLKTEIEDMLDEVKDKLKELESSSLNFTWERNELPIALRRLDKPWEDFNHELLVQAHLEARAMQAAEKERLEKEAKKAAKKGKKVAAPKVAPKVREVPSIYCAKVMDPGAAVAADGRVFNRSDAAYDDAGAKTLVKEVEVFMKFSWRYIVERGKFNFEQVGLLPVVHTATISRSRAGSRPMSGAATITPFMQNGSVGAVIKALAGKRSTYAYKPDLLLANAKTLVSCMAFLEHHGIYHGNIHPFNIFVSDDGFRLLIGDFIPPSEFKRWLVQVAKGLASVPPYCSPEYYTALTERRIQRAAVYVNTLSPHKHDVFCLGLVMLQLATLQNVAAYRDKPRRLKGILEKFQNNNDSPEAPELAKLISRMLTINPAERPPFKDLVDVQDRWTLQASDWVRGFAEVLGFGKTPGEELYLDKSLTPPGMGTQTPPPDSKKDKNDKSTCSVM